MLTVADKEGGWVWEMLTLTEKGGRGICTPPPTFLADISFTLLSNFKTKKTIYRKTVYVQSQLLIQAVNISKKQTCGAHDTLQVWCTTPFF